jgi:hypothetical protein
MPFPKMALVAQKLRAQPCQDISSAVQGALESLELETSAKPGESVVASARFPSLYTNA